MDDRWSTGSQGSHGWGWRQWRTPNVGWVQAPNGEWWYWDGYEFWTGQEEIQPRRDEPWEDNPPNPRGGERPKTPERAPSRRTEESQETQEFPFGAPGRKRVAKEERTEVKDEEPSRPSRRSRGDQPDQDPPDRDRSRKKKEQREGGERERSGREPSRGPPPEKDDDKDRDRRRKDEDKGRRGEDPPRVPKRSRGGGGPPDGGGDDDDDDDDSHHSSQYTYEYETDEEESEEERRTQREAAGRARRPRGAPSEGSAAGSTSTAKTSEVREMLAQAAKKQTQERSKPALSQIKIEPFRGSRQHYKDWRKILDAQRALYRLDDSELALLIYLSCEGEARQVLNQLGIGEIQEAGGLNRVLKLLEDSYGSRADERFEERQEAFLSYRRSPGTSIAAYIANLKRLRQEYLTEDQGTTLSDKSFAQRMLSRAALTRRERMDVFFSAGGRYKSRDIERVLRFRCQNIHVEEKGPATRRYPPQKKFTLTSNRGKPAGPPKKPYDRQRPHRSSRYHGSHVAETTEDHPEEDDEDEEDDDAADNEDLEQEVLNMEHEGPEEEEYYEEGHWWDEEEEGYGQMEELKEAYAAGWSAKHRSASVRKARGYSEGGKSKGKGKGKQRPDDRRNPEDRKKKSRCAACGQIGHWHSDPQCPKNKEKAAASQPSGALLAGTSAGSGDVTSSAAPGTRVSKVNWTFMMRHERFQDDGWERIRSYESEDSESESGSSTDEEAQRMEDGGVFAYARRREEASGSGHRRGKYKVDVRKVLKALSMVTEDEEAQKRLQKKEKKLAKEELEAEERRKRKLDRAHKRIRRYQSTDATAQEMLTMLPHLSKDEKQELYRALKREQEEEELQNFRPDYPKEYLKRRDERPGGYQASPERVSGRGRESGGSRRDHGGPQPPPSQEESRLPEPVRKKRLHEFRKGLYEAALDRRGRVRLSEASDVPTKAQETCHHPYERLAWGANGAAHWASCRACGLRKVLYYSHMHGAMVVSRKERKEKHQEALSADIREAHEVMMATTTEVILDTGCRTAVAGEEWHKAFQATLAEKGLSWDCMSHEEVFRFGAGKPVLSTEAVIYPVQLGGDGGPLSYLRLAVVSRTAQDDRVAHCPALVGPSEMRRWQIKLNFADGTMEIGADGKKRPTQFSQTRHPILALIGSAPADAWRTKELQDLRTRLQTDPYSMALLAEALDGESADEEEKVEVELHQLAEPDDGEVLAELQESLEDEAISLWDHVMPEIPPGCLVSGVQESDDDSLGSVSTGESETSHEDQGGSQGVSSSSETEDEMAERHLALMAEVDGDEEVLNKGQRRRLLAAAKTIQEGARAETLEHEAYVVKPVPRTPGSKQRFRILEIFTWSCMVSLTAARMGWEFLEPVTLESGWDLTCRETQDRAMQYIKEVSPDLLVVAWPCGPWSPLQQLNVQTETQRRALRAKRRANKPLLAFARRAVLWQRSRGGAVGENPERSKAWDQEEIVEAFQGLPGTVLDQCQYGLRHPVNGMPLRKRTRLHGQARVLKYLQKRCKGDHEHHPIEGSFKGKDGKWQSLSTWAGGYPASLCRAMVKGAEEFLRSGEAYVEDPHEEDTVPDDLDGPTTCGQLHVWH